MIVATNNQPHKNEFDALLANTLGELNNQAKNKKSFESLSGRNLEPYIAEVMNTKAVNTPFAGTIECIGGQRFPDIIAYNFYGVEVKTTTQNHWKSTGNSVLESTRIENIERIFMLFAKLASPVEFKCRPYEECLADIVVTHSPRYTIDMNLAKGKTIFDKIGIEYDDLRKRENPIHPIVDFYKSKLKPGEDLWWIDPQAGKASNLIIRVWNNLDTTEQNFLRAKAMVLFPEIFNKKFDNFSLWLITNESILCHNLRDIFTAGGRKDFNTQKVSYTNIPQVVYKLLVDINLVTEILKNTTAKELAYYWKTPIKENAKISVWQSLVIQNIKKGYNLTINPNHLV